MVIKDRTEISSPLHPSLVLSSVKTISTRCWWSLIFRHGRQRHQTQTGADPHFGGHHHSLQSRTSRILRDVPVIHVGAEGMRYVYFLFILRVYGLTKHDTRSRQLTWRGFEKGTLCNCALYRVCVDVCVGRWSTQVLLTVSQWHDYNSNTWNISLNGGCPTPGSACVTSSQNVKRAQWTEIL